MKRHSDESALYNWSWMGPHTDPVERCNVKVASSEFRVPYSQRYLFNATPHTNHNANPNRYSKGTLPVRCRLQYH